MDYSTLAEFRDGLHQCFLRASDALMDINDALLTQTHAKSLPELTLSPCFQRKWPSLYQAFQEAIVSRSALRRLHAAFVPKPEPGQRLLLGIDVSPIARPDSPTARDRTCIHASNLPPGSRPVTVGWQFSSLVGLPAVPSSFVYTLDVLRVPSHQTPAQVGVQQLGAVLPLLPSRPLLVGDRAYGSWTFFEQVAPLACDKLFRLQRHRVLYRVAPPKTGGVGRPALHGARFQPKEATTHGPADATWVGTDSHGRPVEVCCWNDLHFRKLPGVSVSVIRVVRPQAPDTKRDPRVSWYLWQGEGGADLSQVVSWYGRRFSQEHGYRYAKGSLLWETARLRTPEQFQVWSDVVGSVMNQLVLSRDWVGRELRPWQSVSCAVTPEQIRRGMGRILAKLGTPSRPPQPRGKSPGRSLGAVVQAVVRYEVVKKTRPKRKTEEKMAKKSPLKV